jgi:hypothetical protein
MDSINMPVTTVAILGNKLTAGTLSALGQHKDHGKAGSDCGECNLHEYCLATRQEESKK